MNKKQRLVLAIFVPMIVFFIALIIANSVGYTVITKTVSEVGVPTPPSSVFDKYAPPTTCYYEGNPFDWERTWYIWLLSLIFCCIFEYRLFGD